MAATERHYRGPSIWAFILIGVGLELLVGRGSRGLSLLIGAGTVALLIALMFVGPSPGLARSAEIRHQQRAEPVDGATSAQVNVGIAVGELDIHPLTDSNNLMEADVHFVGTLQYDASGETERVIRLNNEDDAGFDFFGFLNFIANGDEMRWDVGLNPDVPTDLHTNSGTGGAAVRVVAQTGTGGVDVPGSFERVSGGDDDGLGEDGTWQTPGFDSAENRIVINFDGGTGGLSVRQ